LIWLRVAITHEPVKNANPVSLLQRWFGVALLALAFAGCGESAPPAAPAAEKTVSDFFDIRIGAKLTHLQLAVREGEMEHGLMGRRALGADEGMLFVYERPQRMSFWMHDTPTALDIGFFDRDGKLKEVWPMQPFDETTVSSHGRALQFALEMNQGWYAGNGIRPGAQLDLTALSAALAARGFKPSQYGLK
jgi:uncharacterized membrane protein (UPF0127 family)